MQSTTTNAVFLECYLAHNVGDDLFLETLLRRYPDTHFTCVADGSYDWLLERYHNISLVRPPRKKSALRGKLSLLSSIAYTNGLAALKCQSVRNCGILAVIGGSLYIQPIWKHSLFTTVFSLRDVLQRKRLYSSADKTFVLGTNFGPYRNSWYKKSYSDIFNKYVTDICFRDQYSFQLFKSDEHIRVAPDILFGTEFPRVERKKKVLFSVVDLGNTMKFRDLSSCSADYDSWIVNAANCYANLGYDIQLCGFSTVEHDDVAVARISHLLAQESIQHDCLTYDNDTSRILSAIAESEVIVGTRFHASILGLAAGCKVLPIIYSDKTSHSLDPGSK